MVCYYTDASNCSLYDWTVTDADGNTITPDSGQEQIIPGFYHLIYNDCHGKQKLWNRCASIKFGGHGTQKEAQGQPGKMKKQNTWKPAPFSPFLRAENQS